MAKTGKLESKNIIITPELTQTVNFDNSMTAADMQELIDAVGKYIPYGQTVTFQFSDGTYNTSMTSALTWGGFYGAGRLNVYGNISETNASILHTSQQVYLDFSAGNTDGIVIDKCNLAYVVVRNLKINIADSNINCINLLRSNSYIDVYYNYLLAAGKTSSPDGIDLQGLGTAYCYRNYVSNLNYGLHCQSSTMFSYENDDTGTAPNYGLVARNAGVIGKFSTQPSGTSSDEAAPGGGEIR